MKTLLSPASAAALALGLSLSPVTAQDAAPAAPSAPAPAESAPTAPKEAAPDAPAPKPIAETDVVLEIDGTPIRVLDIRELFTARFGRQFENMPAEERALVEPQIQQMVMNELIQKTLLVNAAEKEGLKATEEEVETSLQAIADEIPEGETLETFAKNAGVSLERIREQIGVDTKIRKLMDKVTAEIPTPTEADLKKYFEEHPDQFAQKDSVEAAHILISTQGVEASQVAAKEKIAKELREEIVAKKGENFAEMAGLHSDCPSKAQGGDLGEFEKGQMVPEFEKAAFSQEVGAIGDLVKTDFGYHIIKVNGRKPAKTLSFDEVKADLGKDLLEDAKNEKMGAYLKDLRDKAKIVQPNAPAPEAAPAAPQPIQPLQPLDQEKAPEPQDKTVL